MKKRRALFPFPRPYVFVPMCIDFLHHGHINVFLKAKKYGRKIIAGLMTDEGIKKYKKKKPIIKFKDRKKILEHLDFVDYIIPIKNLNFYQIAKKYKFDYWVHGTDWRKGVQSHSRKKLKETMKKWRGKVIDVPYTKGISSSIIKKELF